MEVEVTFYGRLRDVAGGASARVRVDGAEPTVQRVTDRLRSERPGLAEHLDSAAFAVGDRLVDPDRVLRDGEQLDVLPPVSGG